MVNDLLDFDPKDFSSDKQRDLYAYWLKIKKDRLMPRRKDFDPLDIPHILSSIWMADVIPGEEPQFIIRLLGTDIVNNFKIEGANRNLDEVQFTADIIDRFKMMVERKVPYYYVGDFPVESNDYKYYSSITMPLSVNAGHEEVDIILSSVHPF